MTSKALKRSPGRPSKYTQDLADRICTRIASDESLRKICKEKGLPAISTVLLWVARDHEGFSDQYARVQIAKAHHDADQMQEIFEKVETGQVTPGQGRVMFDILRWSAERRAPKKYGALQKTNSDFDGVKLPTVIRIIGFDPATGAKTDFSSN